MGLSVISNIAATVNSASKAASGATGTADNAAPADFAALLSGQTLSNLLSPTTGATNSLLAADKAALSKTTETTEDSETDTQLLDPAALVALMGNPHAIPEQKIQAAPPTLPANEGTETALPLIGSTRQQSAGNQQSALSLLSAASEKALQASASADTAEVADAANIAAAESPANTSAFSSDLAAAAQRRESAASQTATVSTPLHSEAWPQHFGEKLVWMAKNDQQSAQININPPQLGPVQITLNLSGDQATAIFTSPHAEVRQAIESSLPQLRDMLSSAGIMLGDANVGANLAQQNQNTPFQTPNRAQSSGENAILPANDNAPVAGVAAPLHIGRGLVDLFA